MNTVSDIALCKNAGRRVGGRLGKWAGTAGQVGWQAELAGRQADGQAGVHAGKRTGGQAGNANADAIAK